MDEFTGPIYGKDFESGEYWKKEEPFTSGLQPSVSLHLQEGGEEAFSAAWRMGASDQFAYVTPQQGGVDWTASGYQRIEDPELLGVLEML